MPSKSKPRSPQPIPISLSFPHHDDDDDFEIPLSQSQQAFTLTSTSRKPLKPSNTSHRKSKKPKLSATSGKENAPLTYPAPNQKMPPDTDEDFDLYDNCGLDLIESSFDCSNSNIYEDSNFQEKSFETEISKRKEGLEVNTGYLRNSIEARLMRSVGDSGVNPVNDSGLNEVSGMGDFDSGLNEVGGMEDFDDDVRLDLLIKLCNDDVDEESKVIDGVNHGVNHGGCLVQCPICGIDISDLSEESRLLHTNDCLDNEEKNAQEVCPATNNGETYYAPEVADNLLDSPSNVVDVSPVIKWLKNLGLEKYEEAFVREEIDWDSLKWLTEEDLFIIGVTALGPRKKIMQALGELRKGCDLVVTDAHRVTLTHTSTEVESRSIHEAEMLGVASKVLDNDASKSTTNKLITDYFRGSVTVRKKTCTTPSEKPVVEKNRAGSVLKQKAKNRSIYNRKLKDIPLWCTVPGTPF